MARNLTDGAGRQVEVPHRPVRILSMAPSVTETLAALGAWDRVVGITDYCKVPEGRAEPARIGGLIGPDLEKIVELKPDLALASTAGNYEDDARRIQELGIPVFTLHTPSVEAVLEAIEQVGDLLGSPDRGREVARGLRARLDQVGRRVDGRPRPKVLFVTWDKPIIAPGRDAFVTDALKLAGADSITAEMAGMWPEIDLETIIASRPEMILTVPHQKALVDSLRTRSEWMVVPAVRDGRIHVVGEEIQQPGPRIIDGIEEVARLLHPREGARAK